MFSLIFLYVYVILLCANGCRSSESIALTLIFSDSCKQSLDLDEDLASRQPKIQN